MSSIHPVATSSPFLPPFPAPLLASLPWESPTAAAAEAAADPVGQLSLSTGAFGIAGASPTTRPRSRANPCPTTRAASRFSPCAVTSSSSVSSSSAVSRGNGRIARASAAGSSDVAEKTVPQTVDGCGDEGRQGVGGVSRGRQTEEAFGAVEMKTAGPVSEGKQKQQQQSLLTPQTGEQDQGRRDAERLVSPEAKGLQQTQPPGDAKTDNGSGDNSRFSEDKAADLGVDGSTRSSSSSSSSSQGVERETEEDPQAWCPQATLASVIEREPRLAQAVEAFELKHPGSTVM